MTSARQLERIERLPSPSSERSSRKTCRSAIWRLPPKPGFYQIEAAMDYGEAGLAFDSMVFELVLGETA